MELNISDQSVRDLVHKATEFVLKHLHDHKKTPSMEFAMYKSDDDDEAAVGARRFAARFQENDAPEEGKVADDVFDIVCQQALRAGTNTSSAGFCAFINGGGIIQSAIAELLAAGLNMFTGTWHSAPAFVQLECNVIKWMCRMIGFPDEAFGCFTSGGSMANFVGLVIAREHLDEEEIHKMVVYVTKDTHACIMKSARMAGVRLRNICHVTCDEERRMDAAALQKAIQETRAAGLTPLAVVATSGTTNDGTVDDLQRVTRVCHQENVWLHVDGVYGAAFSLTERGKKVLAGLEEADSVAIDLHKSFFLPGATGILVARQRAHLRHAFSTDSGSYLPGVYDEDVDFNHCTPELSRNFRGLRIWLPLQLCGLRRWREALDERLDWTEKLFTGLTALAKQGIELLKKPQLTIIAFRYNVCKRLHERDGSGELSQQSQLNMLNDRLLRFINRRNHIYISPTTLDDGRFFLRVCVLNVHLSWAVLESGLADIRDGVMHLNSQMAQ